MATPLVVDFSKYEKSKLSITDIIIMERIRSDFQANRFSAHAVKDTLVSVSLSQVQKTIDKLIKLDALLMKG